MHTEEFTNAFRDLSRCDSAETDFNVHTNVIVFRNVKKKTNPHMYLKEFAIFIFKKKQQMCVL